MRTLSLLLTALLAPNSALATDYSHLIPDFPPMGVLEYDMYVDRLDSVNDLTAGQRPTPQLDQGMAGLFDPNEGFSDAGVVESVRLFDSQNHYEEHWFIIGDFQWDAPLDVEMLDPAVVAGLPAGDMADPYLYMDIRYKQVPDAAVTDGLTNNDPQYI